MGRPTDELVLAWNWRRQFSHNPFVDITFPKRSTGTPDHGILSVPRFEVFLLILLLP